MNTKTLVTVKVDKKIKKAAEFTARRVGLPLGTVINGFLRNFINEQRVEFYAPLVPNPNTRKIIGEARREFAASRATGPFRSVSELVAALEK
ncbi:MAG: hypothetical protein HYT46_03610 [Candidatus Vogelbacteria bacterium]|nr:hypothetical protein [Candidatus Vogelbacteria bacterium]